MIDFDYTSDEAYLVFEVTFPFMRTDLSDDRLNALTDNILDAYRCGKILLQEKINELIKNNLEVPDYYYKAHTIIFLTIEEEKNKL